jgi:hypothetical protein
MRWAGQAARIGAARSEYQTENMKRRYHLGETDLDWRITLNRTLKKKL